MHRIVLVDSSIWIDFLRKGTSKESEILDELLRSRLVVTCDPIKVEIVSGSSNREEFNKLRNLFHSIVLLEPSKDIWSKVEEQRFLLARKGVRASLVDLYIVNMAKDNNALLWTLDNDFIAMSKVIHFEAFDIYSFL